MRYLLSLNLSNFEPQEIPVTKMKSDIMRDQLPNPIRFIIDFIADGDRVSKQSRTLLYQKYLEWCGENGEKPLTSKVAGKKFSDIGIESKQARTGGGKREWQYIIDRSKIVAKLRESGLGDMEEFSDIPQPDLPENRTTDVPIFNAPEIIPPKIIPPQLEKNTSPSNNSKDKKADKQDESTQALFDYVAEDAPPVASSSKPVEISKVIDPASLRPVVEKRTR
jgi:phage/plasmid-associated DNA primase